MTNRARGLIALGLMGVLLGTFRGQAILSLLSFSVIAWIVIEWIRFQASVRIALPKVQFRRLVNDRDGANGTLWAGRKILLRLQAKFSTPANFIVEMQDAVPEMLEVLHSPANAADKTAVPSKPFKSDHIQKLLTRSRDYLVESIFPKPTFQLPNFLRTESRCSSSELVYEAHVRAAGQLTIPGVRLTIKDECGLFRHDRFSKLTQSYRVLPTYHDSGELRPTVKRNNSLPRQGIHRMQRAGMGSELLELRDYVVGDPPKSIAWKVSARRDKLLTRQYESEVPVRVHLIVDGSMPTRIGGYGYRLLDQMNYVAASVAKAAINVGDPVSGTLVDESGVRRLPWMSGDRGFMDLLKALSDFSVAAPPEVHHVTPYMLHCTLALCHQRYPELLDSRFNFFPLRFRSETRKRHLIAGVLGELFQLTPKQQMECICNDTFLASQMRKFLWQEGMAWVQPVVPVTVDPPTAAAERVQRICDCLHRSVAHARDNELFVVLADLLSYQWNFPQFARSVRMARAKHHRVAFVCPTTTFLRPQKEIIWPETNGIGDLLLTAERSRVRELSLIIKRELVQAGATISFSGEQNAIEMVIAELETARDGRTRPLGARR